MDKWGWILVAVGVAVVGYIFFKSREANAAEGGDSSFGGVPASGGVISGGSGMTSQSTGSEGGMSREAAKTGPDSCGPGQFWSAIDNHCKNAGETPDAPAGGLGYKPTGATADSPSTPVDLGKDKPTPVDVVGGRGIRTSGGGWAGNAFASVGAGSSKMPSQGGRFSSAVDFATKVANSGAGSSSGGFFGSAFGNASKFATPVEKAKVGADISPTLSKKTFGDDRGGKVQISENYGRMTTENKWGGR